MELEMSNVRKHLGAIAPAILSLMILTSGPAAASSLRPNCHEKEKIELKSSHHCHKESSHKPHKSDHAHDKKDPKGGGAGTKGDPKGVAGTTMLKSASGRR
jgi:hypothetical protein